MQVFLVRDPGTKKVVFVSPSREGAYLWGAENMGRVDISGLPESQFEFDITEFEVGVGFEEATTRYVVYADWRPDADDDVFEYTVTVVDEQFRTVLTETLAVA